MLWLVITVDTSVYNLLWWTTVIDGHASQPMVLVSRDVGPPQAGDDVYRRK